MNERDRDRLTKRSVRYAYSITCIPAEIVVLEDRGDGGEDEEVEESRVL